MRGTVGEEKWARLGAGFRRKLKRIVGNDELVMENFVFQIERCF